MISVCVTYIRSNTLNSFKHAIKYLASAYKQTYNDVTMPNVSITSIRLHMLLPYALVWLHFSLIFQHSDWRNIKIHINVNKAFISTELFYFI